MEPDKALGKALLRGYILLLFFLLYLMVDNPFDQEQNESELQQEYSLISKYKYVLDTPEPEFQYTPELENKIWMVWLQGEENAPDIVKASINSVRAHANGREVIVLDKNTVKKYTKLPDYVWKKFKEKKMTAAMLSDLIRLDLLFRYGGTWIDATVLLEDRIPDKILNSDVFMFQLINSCTNAARRKYHTLESWFIHATPHNRLILKIREILLEYFKYEKCQCTYLLMYSAITCVINNDNVCKMLYKNMPKYREQFLFRTYLGYDYDEHMYNILSKIFADGVPVLKMCHKTMPGHPPNGSIADYICRKYNVKCDHEDGYR